VLALPEVEPRTRRDVRARQIEEYLAEGQEWWGPAVEEVS
jgi:hypothetical protein